MQRRGLLKLGLGAAVLIGVAGAGIALVKPGLVDGKLSPGSRELMRAAAQAVLGDLLPAAGPAREAALDAQLTRLDTFIAGMPAHTRKELSDALGLLGTAAGRYALVGLSKPWGEASTQDVQQALDAMRLSSSNTRQQVYHALRDLNAIAFFTEPGNWQTAGYPGQRHIP
ncbi:MULTISPECIES: hypothetical protein [unclassified Roseateles]|uniref:hypothetical protein n=1 Tax=unclassified Roseateles TaxID=2626991 RepID=UPI0006F40868|nr:MULTISPECIES: hypothetical protein [unclassified Roseateles]KQW51594.1 hypothetical protein ASC81_02890 [Pelomonas sp. Root405]KRA77827.1 hypothetical protein ASD88_02890 [Pelomonas sp. Root662]